MNGGHRYDGIVITRSYQQFIYYFGKDRDRYVFASSIDKIRGLHHIPIFFVGEYWYSSVFRNHKDELNMFIWRFQTWVSKNFAGC